MEDVLATPSTPLDTALQHVRASDIFILVIGFKAGSLLPNHSAMTYTSAEYAEAVKLRRHVLAFVKEGKRWPWSSGFDESGKDTFLLYGLTEYRDCFNRKRVTCFGYILKVNGELDRIANPNYNRFT
jgi:hypothetical protein